MPRNHKPEITQAMVLDAFRRLQNTTDVMADLGMSRQALLDRVKKLEGEGIVVPRTDRMGRKAYEAAEHVAQYNHVNTLHINDGCVIVGGDAHIWPGERTTMQRAFVAFAKKLKPKAVIANGDFFDGARISRHASLGWEKKPSVRQELEAVQDYMGDLTKAAGSAAKVWNCGNHDARFETRIANSAPEFEGIKGVHLKDHFPFWTPAWYTLINGEVVVRHRELGGEHADFRNAQTSGMRCIVTNHDHRANVTHWVNYRGVNWGVRTGFLGDSPHDPQFVNYLEGKHPNWMPAFAVLTFDGGRLLWPELVTRHDDGVVNWRGELIEV